MDLANLKKEIDEISVKREALAGEISKGLSIREELDEKIEAGRQQQSLVAGELSRLVNQREVNNERIASIERNDERLRGEIKELEEKIESEKSSSKELFEEKKQWDEKLIELKGELEEKLSRFRSFQEELHDQGNVIDEKKNTLLDLQSRVSSKKAEMQGMESLVETLQRRKEQIETEKGSGEEESRSSADSLDEAKKQEATLQGELEELKKQREESRRSHENKVAEERKLSSDIEELKISIGQKQARKRTFEEMQAGYEGYNNAVKFIMKNKPAGIEGTVADLINVPDGFETAMETALGATIQNIICDGDDAAKKAIELLKKEKAGRLTFLPLGSIKPRGVLKEEKVEKSKGFKGYGVDCLEFKEKYRSAVEYLVGNVVVMETMDDAIALSKNIGGSYKLVTLEGEIITAGGAITGGRHKHKSTNIFERKAEIKQLARELDDLEKETEASEKRIGELRQEIADFDRKIAAAGESIGEKERELFAKENEITLISTAITDFESQGERWQKELDNIAREMGSAGESIGKLEQDVSGAESEIKEIESWLEANSTSYEDSRIKLEERNREITEARIAVGSCENEKNKVDAIVGRVEMQMRTYEQDKERKEAELENINREKSNILGSHNENADVIEDKKKAKEELDGQLEILQNQRREVTAKSAEDNRVKEELDRTALQLSNQKNELDIKQARQDTQLENAKNKLWEEFEISYAQAIDYQREDFVMSSAVRENRDIKRELRELGEVNVGAIEEYKEVSERYEFLCGQRSDIEKSMNELNKIITDMDKIIKEKFKDSFDSVVVNFEEAFRELYGGGHAKISLADESDPFNSEIEITAQPPGKQLKHINLLSGGEKTMTAIALMFAVLKTKPTPCCILDEVEAALDDSNLEIFGNYVRSFEGVQFTLITHQKQTMEHADVMYGITMPESGISKVYSLRMEDQTQSA